MAHHLLVLDQRLLRAGVQALEHTLDRHSVHCTDSLSAVLTRAGHLHVS